MTVHPIEKVLTAVRARGGIVRQAGEGEYMVTCPVPSHEDTEPSVSVTVKPDRVLVYDHGGCSTESVVAAWGMTLADLFVSPKGAAGRRQHIVRVYPYRDEDGRVLHETVRFGPKKRFAQRRPDGQGHHVWGLRAGEYFQGSDGDWRKPKKTDPPDAPRRRFPEARRILYRLQELRKAAPGSFVHIVEGEKDADRLTAEGLLATTGPQGAGKWSKLSDDSALDPFHNVIIPDEDKSKNGINHAQEVARYRHGKAASVRILSLPGPHTKDGFDVSDWLDAGHDVEELDQLAQQTPEWEPVEEPRPDASTDHAATPRIVVNDRQLPDVTEDSERALLGSNDPPVLFRRNKMVVRICRDDDDRPTIDGMGVDELRHRLGQCARFIKMSSKGDSIQHVDVFPPIGVVKNILAAAQWDFPPLIGLVEVPVMRPDGSILDQPGYDPATRLYFEPAPGFAIPRIPRHPTREQVDTAARLILDEIMTDFPFVLDGEGEDHSASRANACAMVFEPVVRPVIEGRSPVSVVNAHIAGSGKTLFCSAVSIIATGRAASLFSAPTHEEEWRKQITSALLGGNAVIVIDNVVEPLGSPSLAAAVTAPIWAARRLGVSEDVEIPVRVTWICTGNNLRLAGDLPRRCYWVCLDPATDRPWERKGFRHPELLTWILEHRGEIVAAILTIARAWHLAERPAPGPILGSFESWSRVLSGMLEVAGIPGFLENREAMLDKADDEGPAWRTFLYAWRKEFNERPVTLAEVARRLEDSKSTTDEPDFWELLPGDLLDTFDPNGARRSSFTRRLGKALSKIEEKRFDANGLRVMRNGQAKRAIKWKVVIDASR